MRREFSIKFCCLWNILAIPYPGEVYEKSFTRLLQRIELFLYRRASLIIALTEAFKENLVQRGIPPDKIQVIKNGVDLAFFSPREAPAKLREETGAHGKFVAAYIGTVGLAHAVEQIVAVAERLRNNRDLLFMIVGEGAQKAAIEKLVAHKALQNVKVLPGVSKDQVRDYYALSDVNLVTLKKADLFRAVIPSKIFEIMAMARPMLFTVNGECRRIIDAAGSGIFVEPENVEQHSSRDGLARRYLELLRQVQGPLNAPPGASKRAKL